MSEDPSNTNPAPAAAPPTLDERLDRLIGALEKSAAPKAEASRDGDGRYAEKATAVDPRDARIEKLTEAVERLSRPAPAAAPAAVGGTAWANSMGLVDIFNLHPDQMAQMSPQAMRAEYEKLIQFSENHSGRPQLPTATIFDSRGGMTQTVPGASRRR